MEFIKLTNREQFNNLKKNDVLVIQWKPGAIAHKKFGSITHHSIYGINSSDEVILNVRYNTYFHIGMYLNGESYAEEIYLIKESQT